MSTHHASRIPHPMPSQPHPFDAIHQFHPQLAPGDAVSNQMLLLQRLLRDRGYRSELFAEQPLPGFEGRAFPLSRYERHAGARSLLLLHFSIGYSPGVMAVLPRLPGARLLYYHNITPPEYFRGVNDSYREAAWAGREQLERLQPLTVGAWADSCFNARELAPLGWRDPAVIPIGLDLDRYPAPPERAAPSGSSRLLFVGRVAPNKRLEDLILIQHALRRLVRGTSLHLVGSDDHMGPYRRYLDALVDELGVEGVHFHGRVSHQRLLDHYREADLFLCMSAHEGFGVPLIEAMHFGLPVIAHASGAVPETLGDAGVLLRTREPARIAALVAELMDNHAWRARLVAAQRARLAAFTPAAVDAALDHALEGVG